MTEKDGWTRTGGKEDHVLMLTVPQELIRFAAVPGIPMSLVGICPRRICRVYAPYIAHSPYMENIVSSVEWLGTTHI